MPISWHVREADSRSHLVEPRGDANDHDANDRAIVRADSAFFSSLRMAFAATPDRSALRRNEAAR
jgi:hypothetical protein